MSLRHDPTSSSLEEDSVQHLLGDQLLDGARLRQGCPLQESHDHSWRFLHASLGDYFMTTAVAEQLVADPTSTDVDSLFHFNQTQAVNLLNRAPRHRNKCVFWSIESALTHLAESPICPD